MATKITLETLDKKFDDRFTRLEQLMEQGYAAVADGHLPDRRTTR
jgi:hypothetical protein